MFTERTIIYFNPFYFKDGSPASPKYFIVLKNIEGKTIVANLPSSQNYVPFADANKKHGCIELKEINFCCYCFERNKPIAENEWSFDLDTYMYGKWVDDYELSILEDTYRIEGVDFEIKGVLKRYEYTNLLHCLQTSHSMKRKFKKMIGDWIK